ncbi:hypothetical protein HKBW3S42_00891 [Candidatus Hakubella thermalkaliphila]|uniref:Cytidylate kinase n=2 Tax=Candidatus Hakubella thermalkaliphila TaxID=2754717 RepID=A0A6V8PSV4_9ACTN|nr:cytidylate kinase-like family protein [Candidatus Hakubella thermalkaliphila]MBT9171201.1 Cytidylate kinase [Actinomycetota bacterium]GFP19943.1 hypothetical protein HKBW3S03_01447 [Candidatus Hakubella thermalkaliphila]GFP21453.1 hypothetical protein HKBW3S06_00680 [Candidatus Hakubella thermalkaliphila]GFP30779.1 hypothetical protein HKBW3S34_01698 [Candidatus Hakubella thermalkaliphila]GFP32587.1 hypothetical protein HKBW3S42_00891 [Candidatus Hakubella thermalkaliphila]
MAVVTISRQKGSGGRILAHKLAKKLGYRCVGKDELLELSKKYGLLPKEFEAADERDPGFFVDDVEERYFIAMNKIIWKLAEEGDVVIIGRAGAAILQHFPHSYHIRVIAPVEDRIKRVSEKYNLSYQQATKEVERSDKNRAGYHRRIYKVEIDNPQLYDLVLNTPKLDIERTCDFLADSIKKSHARSQL